MWLGLSDSLTRWKVKAKQRLRQKCREKRPKKRLYIANAVTKDLCRNLPIKFGIFCTFWTEQTVLLCSVGLSFQMPNFPSGKHTKMLTKDQTVWVIANQNYCESLTSWISSIVTSLAESRMQHKLRVWHFKYNRITKMLVLIWHEKYQHCNAYRSNISHFVSQFIFIKPTQKCNSRLGSTLARIKAIFQPIRVPPKLFKRLFVYIPVLCKLGFLVAMADTCDDH